MHYIISVLFLFFVWCPCMAINASIQYNGDSPRHYNVDPMLLSMLHTINPFKRHEEVLSLQSIIPPKRFDISSPDWGMLRRSRCVHIFI